MCSASIFPCIMTIISNFTIFFIFQISVFKFFFTNITDLHFHIIHAALLFITSFLFFLKLIIFTVHTLKNTKNVVIQSLPPYTPCLFSMLLNEDIVDIEKSDEIYSFTFVVDEFSELFLHPPIFSIIHSRFA